MKKGMIFLALFVTAILTACGGGSSTNVAPVATPSATGILSDSPVGGVQYLTSGGFSGVTDANGRYSYNPGETVSFRIGAISLGTVTATGTITPIQLAGTGAASANRVTNLLILLQSLDADNDPSNGITINAATQAAASSAGSLDLAQAPAQFASTGNAALTSILSGAGLPRTTPVDPATAMAHFKHQFFTQLKGAWVHRTDTALFVFRFDELGNYIHSEVQSAPSPGGMAGTEVGKIDWSPTTGLIHLVPASVVFDSNGEWGLSNAGTSVSARFDGDKLVFAEGTESTVLVRVPNDTANPVVGTWVLNELGSGFPAFRTQTFTFFNTGKYMMADPVGDTEAVREGRPSCSNGGVEYGDYTFNAATGDLAVVARPTVDTNSCAGLWNSPDQTGSAFKIVFNAEKSSFTIAGTNQTGHRVSR